MSQPSTASKRGRTRQPASSLTSSLKQAVQQFVSVVGSPRVVEPGGFRDIGGWLELLSSSAASAAWTALVSALFAECGSADAVVRMQSPVVREIISLVVVPRSGESFKVISTNARRQSLRPSSGVTLMSILDSKVAKMGQTRAGSSSASASKSAARPSGSQSRSRKRDAPSSRDSAGGASGSSSSGSRDGRRSIAYLLHQDESSSSGTKPSSQPKLPSMRELDESVRQKAGKSRRSNSG